MNSSSDAILEGRNLRSIGKYINSDKCKNIFVLAGAGISTAAGIPDFRSPETGLYASLERFDLPYPEAVFDIGFFRKNPAPFYALAKELEPGKFRPTLTHAFIRLLSEKGLLHTCFTQNIDTLERRAGIPASKIVEAHGSFATHACIVCKQGFSDEKMRDAIITQIIPRCGRSGCGGLVKPNIVFFGEGLPENFFKSIPELKSASLAIIMGTSLTVHPFAALPSMIPFGTPRLLINREQVGDIGTRVNDVVALGECDVQIRRLCKEIGNGWEEELDRLWGDTAIAETATAEPTAMATALHPPTDQASKDANLSARLDAIAKAVEERLRLTEYTVEVKEDLGPGVTPGNTESTESKDIDRKGGINANPIGGEPVQMAKLPSIDNGESESSKHGKLPGEKSLKESPEFSVVLPPQSSSSRLASDTVPPFEETELASIILGEVPESESLRTNL